jgi:uncharacterized membrane protein YhaH (DUF805 family)
LDRIPLPDSSTYIWLFFRFNGRVGRVVYFLAGLLLAVVQAFFLYRFMQVDEASTAGQMWASLFWVAVIASVWSNVALGVKRLHDFDKPGIVAVALFIPVVSIVAFIALCLIPGDPGPNRYGPPPQASR